jgi:hypothetical protein
MKDHTFLLGLALPVQIFNEGRFKDPHFGYFTDYFSSRTAFCLVEIERVTLNSCGRANFKTLFKICLTSKEGEVGDPFCLYKYFLFTNMLFN